MGSNIPSTGGALPCFIKGPALAAAAHPDAALLDLCHRFDALERHIQALSGDGPSGIEDDDERDAAIDPLWQQMHPLVDGICRLRATTIDGNRARAQSLILWNGDFDAPVCDLVGSWDTRMAAAVLRDLLAAGSI